MSFLGPDGITDRMAQIQARLDSFSPPTSRVAPQTTDSFGKTLQSALDNGPVDPTGLSNPIVGPIGGQADLQSMADQAADRNGVDRRLFRALIKQESGWDTNAKSRVGAKGLCQLMDGTARDMGVSDPYDPGMTWRSSSRTS